MQETGTQETIKNLSGRIGALTWNDTKDGGVKLTLRLAEHPNAEDQNATNWHKAVATRTLAEKLKTLDPPLKAGEVMEIVTGYPYVWQYADNQGEEKVNKGINLWVVKVRGETYRQTRKPKQDQSPDKTAQKRRRKKSQQA